MLPEKLDSGGIDFESKEMYKYVVRFCKMKP